MVLSPIPSGRGGGGALRGVRAPRRRRGRARRGAARAAGRAVPRGAARGGAGRGGGDGARGAAGGAQQDGDARPVEGTAEGASGNATCPRHARAMPAPRPRHPSQRIACSPRHARAMPAPRPRQCPVTPEGGAAGEGAVRGRGASRPAAAGRRTGEPQRRARTKLESESCTFTSPGPPDPNRGGLTFRPSDKAGLFPPVKNDAKKKNNAAGHPLAAKQNCGRGCAEGASGEDQQKMHALPVDGTAPRCMHSLWMVPRQDACTPCGWYRANCPLRSARPLKGNGPMARAWRGRDAGRRHSFASVARAWRGMACSPRGDSPCSRYAPLHTRKQHQVTTPSALGGATA
eukprot:gene25516-biopygen10514